MRLSGARVLVTGGSSGIGRAVALQAARRGCVVTIAGSDPDRVAAVADRLAAGGPAPSPSSARAGATPYRIPGQSTPPLVCDFADPAAVSDLADRLAREPAFDVVVHSAGIGLRGPAGDLAAPDLDRLLAVNVRAPLLLTGAVLGPMLQRGSGRLVFVGSIAGAVGAAGEAAYAASKAALAAYADSLRAELAGSGVGVTVLLPGVVDTAFFTRRGTPYHRSRPRPIPAERVARALLRAVERDRDLLVAPGWLRVPIALHGVTPQSFGRLAGRFGR
jgi:NAD(P)-dependent dehydrogenase (short-subunit alcohol dehydrogenase family)